MLYGYILREYQDSAREKLLFEKCDKVIYSDTKGSPLTETFLLEVDQLSAHDVVLTYVDQIATSVNDLIEIYEKLIQKEIRLEFAGVERGQNENVWMLQLLKEIQTIRHMTHRESILAGKQKAIESGKKDGRPFTRGNEEIAQAVELMKTKTMKEVSEITGIPYGTLRFYKRKRK